MDDSSPERTTPDTKEIISPFVDPSVYIFSDAIKRAMESFADAHRQSMAAMADTNAAALAAAVDRIAQTMTPRVGHTYSEVLSHGIPRPLLHMPFRLQKKGRFLPQHRHIPLRLPRRISTSVVLVLLGNGNEGGGAHTAISVATTATSGNTGRYSPSHSDAEKSGRFLDDDAFSLVASDNELEMDPPITSPDPSTVASSLKELNKMYDSGERVGLPLSDYMAESLNVMGKHHMERAPLESLLGQQIRPSNIDL